MGVRQKPVAFVVLWLAVLLEAEVLVVLGVVAAAPSM